MIVPVFVVGKLVRDHVLIAALVARTGQSGGCMLVVGTMGDRDTHQFISI